ncbi:MAG: heme-binding domain-containing protein [Planctomycetes bacterium]|nr:heme-binding domain-containing protein [Planctomycetota bacterium]
MAEKSAPASSWKRRWARRVLFGLAAVFVLIQFVPYGHSHANPPVVKEPNWDSPATRAFAVRACFDCHSNESRWPWYSHVAPVSWFLQDHVDEARGKLNFSDFTNPPKRAGKAAREVEKGDMPLKSYLLLHGDAKLTDEERAAFVNGLKATFGTGEKK